MSGTEYANKMDSLTPILLLVIPLSVICWVSNIAFRSYYLNFDTTEAPGPWRWIASSLLPLILAGWGLRRKSLSLSGAVAASVVGFLMTISSLCFSASIIAFFLTSSKATKFRSRQKQKLEEDFKEGGQRNWIQVFCNGSAPATFALVYVIDVGSVETVVDFRAHYVASWLSMSVLGAVACCNGDTWASEIGTVLGGGSPRLITTLSKVPKGTNGGVTLVGLLSSLLGGLVVGVTYYITLLLCTKSNHLSDSPPQWPIILVGGASGFLGSVIDSFLGATLQYSGYSEKRKCITEHPGEDVHDISGVRFLDNHSVNLVSSVLTALLTPHMAFWIWANLHLVTGTTGVGTV